MKWSKIIDYNDANNMLQGNMFKFQVSTTRKDNEGNTYNFIHNFDIPDFMVRTWYGDRKVNKNNKHLFKNDPTIYFAIWYSRLSKVLENYKYQIQAFVESSELYYNPLYNVDGVEVVTEDMAKRERNVTNDFGNSTPYTTSTQYGQDTNTMKYGNNASYTQSMQYGQDTNTMKYGNNALYSDTVQYGEVTTTEKTSPFDETSAQYPQGSTTTGTHTDTTTHNPHTDVNERSQHTDTATFNPHTDVNERSQHTDTTTYNPHTDKEKIADDAYKNTITTKRSGNIGVTKSTDLIESYRNVAIEYYRPVLDLLMSFLSEGY